MVTKLKNKKGISLIVLVITIIVLAILAAAVIISISNTNIMTKARESTFKADMQEIKSKYSIWLANYITSNKTYDVDEINYAAGNSYLLDTILGGQVPTKYQTGLKVVKGKLYFDTEDAEQSAIIEEIGMAYVPETPQGPSILVNGSKVVLTEDNIKDYYGAEVTNYTAGDATYRIFFVDFDGDFGAEGTVYLKADYDEDRTGYNQYTEKSTASTLKIDQMNPLWAAERGTSKDVTWNDNEKGAAYLCDTTQWTTYLDSTKADFAIGSPSVEMWVASYNGVPHTVGNNILGAVYSATDYPGYMYTVDGGSADYYTVGDTIDNVGYNNMYCPADYVSEYYWFSSPSSVFSNLVCSVVGGNADLAYDNWDGDDDGVCPVVSLKSSFQASITLD